MNTNCQKRCFAQLERWLEFFSAQFDLQSRSARFCLDLKYEHSRIVAKESAELASAIGLTPDEIEVARIIGLTHDVGRFPQYAHHRTFNDRQSLDHGALGAAIVGDNSIFSALDHSDRLVVESAILHHNKPRLPEFLSRRCHLFAQIIRDADKLDIFRVTRQYRDHPLWLINFAIPDDGDASPEILDGLMAWRHVPYGSRKNQTDCTLLELGWVFDLNFDYTLHQMVDRGHYAMLKSTLPDSERIRKALNSVDRYVAKRLGRYRERPVATACLRQTAGRR